jgi:diguanylate cyclase (GGDEF)-like protein
VSAELVGPYARPRVLLVGDPSARPAGLERALTRAGFQLVEREDPLVDPEADAILITLNDISEAPLRDLLPPPVPGPDVVPPRIVISSEPDRDALAAALSQGAADVMSAPIHLPELCARLHARIRDKLEAARGLHWQQLRDAAEAVIQPGLDPEELVLTLVRRLARTFDLAHCSFISVAPGGESVRVIAEVQRPSSEEEHLELSRHPEIAEAIRTRKPVVKAVESSHSAEAPRTLIVVPIEGENGVSATLLLGTREAHRRLSPLQLEFAAGLARTAAVALEENERVALMGNGLGDRSREVPQSDEALQALDRRIREEFERARRYSLSFSLILLGVDELNGVRERLGPDAADRLKRDVADVLRRELRLPDFVVGYGASEFAIVLPETGPAGARQSVLRVRERLAVVPSDGDPRLEHPRFSAGIVTYPHPAVSQSDELYAILEAALMRGKAQSGERIGVAV